MDKQAAVLTLLKDELVLLNPIPESVVVEINERA
jgi:hypothetical protein